MLHSVVLKVQDFREFNLILQKIENRRRAFKRLTFPFFIFSNVQVISFYMKQNMVCPFGDLTQNSQILLIPGTL